MTNYTVDTLEKETDIGEFTALCLDTENAVLRARNVRLTAATIPALPSPSKRKITFVRLGE